LFMRDRSRTIFIGFLLALTAAAAAAQVAKKAPATADGVGERAAKLAETGRCAEALPLLKRSFPGTSDKELKLRIGFDAVRCAMTLNQTDLAVDFLRTLHHEFARSPEVLYLSVHIYSDLSTHASQELLAAAPDSYQVHQLNAESLEIQGKWDEAAAEYRKILEQNPHVVGIHFRLGRILLSRTDPDSSLAEQAKREFQQELEIDPTNAGAEYVLGELASQAQQTPEAIEHFTRATRLDAGFVDAFLGLGMALVTNKQYSDAIPPLEIAVKAQPANPTGHYYLAIAYGRVGRKADAEKEAALHRQTSEAAAKEDEPKSPAAQEPAPPQ
jgi:tetratricopeptide (TPR) repeat protein